MANIKIAFDAVDNISSFMKQSKSMIDSLTGSVDTLNDTLTGLDSSGIESISESVSKLSGDFDSVGSSGTNSFEAIDESADKVVDGLLSLEEESANLKTSFTDTAASTVTSFNDVNNTAGDLKDTFVEVGASASQSFQDAAAASGSLVDAANDAAAALDKIKESADSAGSSVSDSFSSGSSAGNDLSSSLGGVNGAIIGIVGTLGGKSISDLIFGTGMKAEVNQVLLKNMTQTEAGAKKLFDTVDAATNKTLVSMQSVIPALNKFRASTGANEQALINVTGEVANFGSYVQAMTGSATLADTAMMDLTKGIDGAFASLDQYGITEKALMDTKLWTGKSDDVEGYMKAVNAVIGDTSELMETTQGKTATLMKKFSVEGKKIFNDIADSLKGVIDLFLKINEITSGGLIKGIILAGTALSGLLIVLGTAQLLGLNAAGAVTTFGNSLKDAAKFGFEFISSLDKQTLATYANRVATILKNTVTEINTGLTRQAIQQAQAHAGAVNTQTLAEYGLISRIKENNIFIGINNQLEKQRKKVKEQTLTASISQSVATWAESVKLQLLNGQTSVAALYEDNYRKAKERSLIATIRNTVVKTAETVQTGVLTAYTVTSTAAERAYAFVKKTVTLANIKSTAAKVIEAGQTAILTTYTAVATAAERAYTFVKELQIGTFIKSSALKLVEISRNAAVAIGIGLLGLAERAYTAIKNVSILATLRDVAAKGLQAAANLKTAISAGIMTAAQIGLNAAMMATPYGLVILGVIALIAAFKQLYNTFPDFKNGIDEIGAGLKELFGALMSGDFSKVGDILKNAWSELPSWLENINQQVEPAIRSLIDGFSNWANNVDWLGELQKAFGNIASWLSGAAANLANYMVEGLKSFSTGLTDWLDGGGAGGQEVGQSIFDGITAWWEENSPLLWELFTTIFMEILPLMGEIGLKIIAALGLALWQGIVWIGQQIWIAWDTNVTQPFMAWLTGIPGWVYNSLLGVLQSVYNWAASLKVSADTAGSDFVNGIITFIQTLPSRIWTWLLNTLSRIASFAVQALNKARTVGTDILNGVLTPVKQLPEKVYTEFMNIGTRILSAGSDLVNKAKKVGEDIYNGIMDALGIHSPGYIQENIAAEFGAIPGRIISVADAAIEAAKTVGEGIKTGFGEPNLDITANSYTEEEGTNTRIYEVDTTAAEQQFTTLEQTVGLAAMGIGNSVNGVNTTISGLNTSLNSTSLGMTSTFSTMGMAISGTLNKLASNNKSSWDNVNATTNSNLKTIQSGTNDVTKKMVSAWSVMGTNLTNTAGNIRTQSYNKFNSLHKSISSFYNQLGSARFSSGGLAAGPIGTISSLLSAPIGRKTSGGGRLRGGRTSGNFGAAGPTSSKKETSKLNNMIKHLSGGKLGSLLKRAGSSQSALMRLQEMFSSVGINPEDLINHVLGSFVSPNVSKIYNTGRQWDIGDPHFLGIRIPVNWKVKDFENGKPSLAQDINSFEHILRQILTARGFASGSTYMKYFDGRFSNQQVWDQVGCNCWDGMELIGEIANMLGLGWSIAHGKYNGIGHVAANIGGRIFDMTQFQYSGGSQFRGRSGVSFAGPAGNGIFDTMADLLKQIADFFTPTKKPSLAFDLNNGEYFNTSNGKSVGDIIVSKEAIKFGDTIVNIDNSNGDLDEEKIASLVSKKLDDKITSKETVGKIFKVASNERNKIARQG